MTVINLVTFAILIALTAFFVATEFAIVKVRQSRIEQLIVENRKGAVAAKHVTTRLDEYLSACQLGITVTALGIGMVGESTFEFILHPLFESLGIPVKYIHIFTIGAAFLIATFLHVVVGELAPKTVAIQKAEAVTLAFSKPIMIFYKILFPFIWFLNGSARVLLGLFGMKPASEHELTHTEEELRLLLTESYKSGEINKNELKYVNNVFEFDDKVAHEIMVPRTEFVGFEKNASFKEVMATISNERYTRYPIYDGDRDHILGFLNIKDFLTQVVNNRINESNFRMENYASPVIKVIESIPIQELLQRMQKERIHMAILIDEYGGTAGLVTAEDILEELVGEIRDEFDDDEIPQIRQLGNDHYILNAKVLLSDVSLLLNVNMEQEDVDTLGGWYIAQNIDLNEQYEVSHEGFTFKIKEKSGRRLKYIEVKKAAALAEEPGGNGSENSSKVDIKETYA